MHLTPLQRLALFVRRRYRAVLLVTAVLVALSIFLTSQLSFNTDILGLLPRHDKAVQTYVQTLQDFGANTYLLVALKIPEGAVVEPYQSLADDLAGRLRQLPELKTVEHRLGDPQELLATFFPKAVLFLDQEGREGVAARLTDERIRERARELRRLLGTPQGIAMKELAVLDPLGLSEVFLDRLNSSRGALNVDWASGYYLSRDRRMLLLLAEPVKPPQDIPFDALLARKAEAEIARSLARWPEIAGADGPAAPEIVMGGPYLTALGDASLIRRDMLINVVTSALGVFLLFLLVFRRPGSLVYAFVPLFAGLLITFGISRLAIGSLSSATSIVAALLIGLGIDFVIVSYGRYIEVRRNGGSVEDGLVAICGSSGTAVLAGATTTAATFYAFAVTDFTGLRQMGYLTGTGILLCAATSLIVLPALLAWNHDRHQKRGSEPRLYLHTFGAHHLMRWAMRNPRPVLAVGLGITALAAFGASRLTFDESMKTMRPKGNKGIDVTVEVGQRFGSGFDSMILVLTGNSVEEVVELSDRAAAGAQELVREGVLYGFSGVTTLIPPMQQQNATLGWLARERSQALDLARIRSTFQSAATAEGLRTEPFDRGLDLLAQAVNLPGPVGAKDFAGSEKTRLLLERYLKHTDRGWKAAFYMYPPQNRWRREAPPQAIALAEKLGPSAALSGTNVVNQRVRYRVVRDAWTAGAIGLAIVVVILLIDFRNLRQTLLALAPLTLGISWMFGGMSLFGIQMNFINIFVTTMIIGIGVDYGIYILHRYGEVKDLPWEEFERGLSETGKGVLAAALSTTIGFGSIMFSAYPGLQSTGKVAVLGALSTSIVATTLLPAILALLWRARQRTA